MYDLELTNQLMIESDISVKDGSQSNLLHGKSK